MAKRKQSKNRKPVARKTKHFQLRVNHPIDDHVAEILAYAKSKRREVTVIRDGVRLLWALENNDLSVLFSMFPHLKPQIAGGGVGGGDDLQQIKSMLEIVVSQRKSHELVMSPAQPTSGKQLAAPKFDLPVFEDDSDDLPTLVVTKEAGHTASDNFLRMLTDLGAEQAGPPKAVAQKAPKAPADEIADNFLAPF